MKYIDTKTQESLKQGVITFLDITEEELMQLFEAIFFESAKEPWKMVEGYVNNITFDESLEYIQMFHLSRRLNGTDFHSNSNLEHLLITNSPISEFLKKYNLSFKQGDNHIDMYYKSKKVDLNDEYYIGPGNMSYIRSRLGFYEVQDYCVNGFAFRNNLEKNDYYSNLSRCPELIERLADFFELKNMIKDYYNNSRYYCFEYLIPMSEIIFDMNDAPKTNQEKTIELLVRSVLRLYDEWSDDLFGLRENLILRLDDKADVKQEWFVGLEELEEKRKD